MRYRLLIVGKRKYFACLLIVLTLIFHRNYVRAEQSCFVSDGSVGLGFSFSMKRMDDRWEWFVNPRTDIFPEYQWTAEPGFLKDIRFEAANAYLSYAVGSFQAGSMHRKIGTIEDLLKAGWGSVNYKNRSLGLIYDSYDSNIFANRLHDSVVVILKSKSARDILMKNKPTHFRMTYASIDKRDNYVCIASVL